jgi:hypothetical protein
MCKYQQQFWLDVQCSALVLNLNNIFSNGHLYRAGRAMNIPPAAILERRQTVKKLKESPENRLNDNHSPIGIHDKNKNDLIFSQTPVVCNVI